MGYGLFDSAPDAIEKTIMRMFKAGLDAHRCRRLFGVSLGELYVIADRHGFGSSIKKLVKVNKDQVQAISNEHSGTIDMLHNAGLDIVDMSAFLNEDINAVYEVVYLNYEKNMPVNVASNRKTDKKYRRRCIVAEPALESYEMDLAVIRMLKSGARSKSLLPYFNMNYGDQKRIMAKYRLLMGNENKSKGGCPRHALKGLSDSTLVLFSRMIKCGYDVCDIHEYTGLSANHVFRLADIVNETEKVVSICKICGAVTSIEERGEPTCSKCAVSIKPGIVVGKMPIRKTPKRAPHKDDPHIPDYTCIPTIATNKVPEMPYEWGLGLD